jgi:hypothetical protein
LARDVCVAVVADELAVHRQGASDRVTKQRICFKPKNSRYESVTSETAKSPQTIQNVPRITASASPPETSKTVIATGFHANTSSSKAKEVSAQYRL